MLYQQSQVQLCLRRTFATPAVQAITPKLMPTNMMPLWTTLSTLRLDRNRYSAFCSRGQIGACLARCYVLDGWHGGCHAGSSGGRGEGELSLEHKWLSALSQCAQLYSFV